MKKYFASFVFLAVAAIFVTVLCLVSFEPLDSLMKPPSSNGENLEIQRSFEKYIDMNYKLRAPSSGDYRSSFIFKDIDYDNQNEVFVFFSDENSLETVKFCFLDKIEGEWKAVSDYESSYNGIQKVDFADINDDGMMEIIVGWEIYQNDLTRNLFVYSLVGHIDDIYNGTYVEFDVVDFNNDKTDDLIVFQNVDGFDGISFSFISWTDNEISCRDTIQLDSSLFSIKSVEFENNGRGASLKAYVDGYKTDSGIVTECVYWNYEKSQLDKIRGSDGSHLLSTRMTNVSCGDINSDGIIEIPVEVTLVNSKVKTSDNKDYGVQSIIKWTQVSEKGNTVVSNQLVYNNDFSVEFSDEWLDKITVTNDYTKGSIYFYSTEKEKNILLFELKYSSNQEEEDRLSNKYKPLTETGKGKLFYIIYNHDSSLNINRTHIENAIVY